MRFSAAAESWGETIDRPIHVAVAVIQNAAGQILISRRPAHLHQGGLWEFPGGKLEPGESVAQALKREIYEELGLGVKAHAPLIRITHHYPDRVVLLDVHRVTQFTGCPEGREGQLLRWLAPEQLRNYPLLPADRPIVTAVNLPDHYLITGADPLDRSAFLLRMERSLVKGVKLVQLRAKSLTPSEYGLLAEAALKLCREHGARLLLNAAPDWVEPLGADGVHLTSKQLADLDERPLDRNYWIGVSCHSADDLARAAALELDFAVLSPVLPTASHPDAQPLGWQQFGVWVEAARLPVYALGGMRRGMLDEAQGYGAQGIAGISGLWPE